MGLVLQVFVAAWDGGEFLVCLASCWDLGDGILGMGFWGSEKGRERER